MNFGDFLFEDVARSAIFQAGIKLTRDADTEEYSALVKKDVKGKQQVEQLCNYLKKNNWKHSEHPSGHVYKHPVTKHTITIYHKSHGPAGDSHHEIVVGKS